MDFNKMINGLGQSGVLPGVAGGLASGALVGALSSKKGRKTAASLLKVGGVAAAGGLAWKAYQHYRDNSANSANSANNNADNNAQGHTGGGRTSAAPGYEGLDAPRFHQETATVTESEGMHILRSMIAAAMADGHILPQEQSLIFERVRGLDLSESERATLFDELSQPRSPESIAMEIGDAALALEVYAAAYLVIDDSCAAGRAHLDRLARALSIPAELITAIESPESDAPAARSATM